MTASARGCACESRKAGIRVVKGYIPTWVMLLRFEKRSRQHGRAVGSALRCSALQKPHAKPTGCLSAGVLAHLLLR
jgi:hypothetical protein